MIIVGFDPGLATLGYGVIESTKTGIKMIDYGAVITPKDDDLPTRLLKIEKGVSMIMEKFKPDQVAIEELFFVKNITNGISVAHARGVLLLTVKKFCEEIYEYTPMQIKLAMTGYGLSKKGQVQEMTKNVLGLKKRPQPDDAADALAVAITHVNTRGGSKFYKVK